MDPLETKLYSDVVGLDDGDIKDFDKVFGEGDFDMVPTSSDGSEEGSENSSSSEDLRNAVEDGREKEDSVEIKINEILNNPEKAKQVQEQKTKSSTRTSLIDEIEKYRELLNERGVEIPEPIQKIIKKAESRTTAQLKEARDVLKRRYNNSETSETITELQMTAIGLLTAVFNGKNRVPLTNFKLNLTGYPQHLRRKMKQITNQNMRIAGMINEKVGDDILELVKYFSLYVSPLIAVIMTNHGPASLSDVDNYQAFDDDDDESEEEDDSGSTGDDTTSETSSD